MKIFSNLQIMCLVLMMMTTQIIKSKSVPAFVSKLESILQKRAREQEKERSLRSLKEIETENQTSEQQESSNDLEKDISNNASTRNEEDNEEDIHSGSRINLPESSNENKNQDYQNEDNQIEDTQNQDNQSEDKDLEDLAEVKIETRSEQNNLESPNQEQLNTEVRNESTQNLIQNNSQENISVVSEKDLNPKNVLDNKEEGSLSNLVNDFAHEAADIAAENYPIEHEDISTSGVQDEIPKMNVQMNPNEHTMTQDKPLPVYPLPENFSQDKHEEIPDKLIDDILRSAAQRRSGGYVLDQDNDFTSRMSDDSAFMGSQQRTPYIQTLGQEPPSSTSSIMTKTSINPIDQSIDHHQIEHQVHEDPLTGQRLHVLTGNSINIPQPMSNHKNPFDTLVGGLLGLFGRGQGSHDIHVDKHEIPVIISKHGANPYGSSTSPSSVNPIIKMKNLFHFGKPNGTPEDFNDYTDENLLHIMNSLQENPNEMSQNPVEVNPLEELEHLPMEHQNMGDLSEGDEILYHNKNHDESEETHPHGGDDIINILEPFHPSNRMKDDSHEENVIEYANDDHQNLGFDEDSVLHDHLTQKSSEDLIRQKAVNDLLQGLIGTTDFNSVHVQNNMHPMMGENYSTSNMGLSKQASPDFDLSSLTSGSSKKSFTDIDDLINHMQDGGEFNLGINEKENSTDQYLMNVLNETGMNGQENDDDLSPTDKEFFKALKEDEGDIDMNSHDQQILASHQNAGMKKVKLEDKSFTSQDEEDVVHQLNNDLLQGKQTVSNNTGLSEGNSKNMDVIGHHKIMLGGHGQTMSKHMDKKNRGKMRLTPGDLGLNQSGSMDNSGIIMLKNSKRNPGTFGSVQYPPDHFHHRKHKRKHKNQHHSSYSSRVDTSELTQVLSQLAGAFGGRRHHHHHRHRHGRHSSTNISTNVHINQGQTTNVQSSQMKSSQINRSSNISNKIRKKENKIVNIENVVHHIYRQPKRKQKINIRVTVKPMDRFKSSGPCEDNCEEEINKHIEEIMNLENSNSEISSDLQQQIDPQDNNESLSHVSHTSHKTLDSGEDLDNQVQSVTDEIETDKLDTEDQNINLENPEIIENKNTKARQLIDLDSDTFYNDFNSDQRRLAQKDFRSAIRKLIRGRN